MVIRILGGVVGLLLVVAPFLGAADFLDAARNSPGTLLGPILGMVFIAYGLGGKRLFSRLAPSLNESARGSTQASRSKPDSQRRLENGNTLGAGPISEEEGHARNRYPVEFTATAGEYFRIWIVNLALTIVTLGIYSAWAKVRKRRYLYSHTRVGGEGFEYRAKPLPILKGRLIALVLLIAVVAAGKFVPIFATQPLLGNLAFVVTFVIAGPWLIVQSFKFNAYNTAYRNIRLRFVATYVDCLKTVAVYGWLLLLPFLYPYFKRRLVEFVAENHYYGTTRFRLDNFRQPFIDAYWSWPSWALAFFVVVGAFAMRRAPAGGSIQILLVICVYSSILMWFAYLRAMTVNALWNSIRIGAVSFQSAMRPRDVIWLYFSNLAAILLTVGLATPWAVIRTHRYRASKTTVIASGGLAGFVQAEGHQVGATGEEVGEMFDIDVAL